jgi:thymidine kinase
MLVVISGGMFAEKSTELQRRGRRLQRAGLSVKYFKPDFDDRYSENEIVTHDGTKVTCENVPVDLPEVLYSLVDGNEVDVLLIDEIQFFQEEIITIINIFLDEGLTVIVSGLDLDFEGNPFNNTALLMAMADEVVKLHAVCTNCGDDAWVSHKKDTGNGGRVELGSDDLYAPLCRKCFRGVRHA